MRTKVKEKVEPMSRRKEYYMGIARTHGAHVAIGFLCEVVEELRGKLDEAKQKGRVA